MANIQHERRTENTVVRLKPTIDKQLREVSDAEGRSLTSIIERALLDYFKKKKS